MADTDNNDTGLGEAFDDDLTPTPPVPGTVVPPKKDEDVTPPVPVPETPPKPGEEPKKDEPAKPEEAKKPEEATPPANDEKKPEEGVEPPKAPETSSAPEEPKPLTKDDVTSIIKNIQSEERTSGQALETTTNEVLEAYYPDGLSNVLVDEKTGKELKTPADVVAVTNGEMSTEEAAQWLMNEQYKLDQDVTRIKSDARNIAETTLNFKRDSVAAVQKYEPLFKAYPALQEKVFNKLMEQVKADVKKNVILSAPDVLGHYDFYLEPYQQAYEYATRQSATNSVPPPETPPAPKPGADDRLDEGGDGGATPPNDPTDFAQQVSKELAKGI